MEVLVAAKPTANLATLPTLEQPLMNKVIKKTFTQTL
jgi:hypothetical protein